MEHQSADQRGGLWDTAMEWGSPILKGAAVGGALGAVGGSLAPGIGTMIGGALGAIGGGVSGLATHAYGKIMGSGQERSPPVDIEAPLDVGSKAVGAQPKPDPKPEDVQQVAALGKAQGKSDKEVEEMITLYHISNAPGWAQKLASQKDGGKTFDELGGLKINPDITMDKRKGDPYGDGRGGDDLGPGFYTTDSAEFVDEYMKKNFDKNNRGGVLSFQVPKSGLKDLSVDSVGADDTGKFQQYMKDGFATFDKSSDTLSAPKLDVPQKDRPFDLISGPINDIDTAKGLGPKTEGDIVSTQGSILKMGDKTPLQYNWATQKGVESLYGKSDAIKYTDMDEWAKQREALKATK